MLKPITSILSNPAIILGIISLVGLVALRKNMSDVIKGTIKTILGFLILQAGAGIIVQALIPFSTLFTKAFHLTGIVAEDNSLVASLQTFLGVETSFILIFSFLINILLARITKWKYIFLTGHMMFSFAGTMAILFKEMGFDTIMIITLGSVVQGICMVLFPAIAQTAVRKITGNNDVAFGFWGSSIIWISGFLGKFFSKSTKRTTLAEGDTAHSSLEKATDKLAFLKDMSILMSIVMVLVYLFTAIFVEGGEFVKVSNGQNVFNFSIFTALRFVSGILILLQGVRMFLGEIVPAFKGISEKIVPGALPALDVPIFYPYAPVAVTIGFLSAMVGGLLVTALSRWLPVAVLPSVIGLFFMGGAAGVFGHAYGGNKGAALSGLFLGFSFSIIIALAYPLIDVTQYGIQGLWFASTDAIIVIVIVRLIGTLFGIPL